MSNFSLTFAAEAVKDLIAAHLDETVFTQQVNNIVVPSLQFRFNDDGSLNVSGEFEGA